VLLMGANGAGKSTLLQCLCGLLRPDSGSIQCENESGQRVLLREVSLGVVLTQSLLYEQLTAEENLRLFGILHGLDNLSTRIASLIEQVNLGQHRRKRVLEYSQGMVKRLSIAAAVMHDPALLLLDEPFSNLDEDGREMLFGILETHQQRGGAVVLASHDRSVVERLSCRVLTLHNGRLEPGQEILPMGAPVMSVGVKQ